MAMQTLAHKFEGIPRILMKMKISSGLSDQITMVCDSKEWIQCLNYKNIPFRCQLCHHIGHMLRDCDLKLLLGSVGEALQNWSKGCHHKPKHKRT
jgi:hypothetical protein